MINCTISFCPTNVLGCLYSLNSLHKFPIRLCWMFISEASKLYMVKWSNEWHVSISITAGTFHGFNHFGKWHACHKLAYTKMLLNFWFPLVKNLVIVIEGDQKASFSIVTTPRCRGGCYSFPWIAPLYPWNVHYIAECSARRYQVPFLKSLVWLDLGLNPGSPRPLANTLLH